MDERHLVDAARLAVAEGSRQQRYEALGALADFLRGTAFARDSAERAAAFLVDVALTSRHADDREEALHALWEADHVWPYPLVEPLAGALPRMSGAELDSALVVLASPLDEAARPVLSRYADHQDSRVREAAVEGLEGLDHARRTRLRDRPPDVT